MMRDDYIHFENNMLTNNNLLENVKILILLTKQKYKYFTIFVKNKFIFILFMDMKYPSMLYNYVAFHKNNLIC